jgi:phosphatidylserine/phosphatidylglycerophosphate/cardiolipin synthase-like enzyme
MAGSGKLARRTKRALKRALSLRAIHGTLHKEESYTMNSAHDTQNKKPKLVINDQNDHFDFYIGDNAGGKMISGINNAKKSIKIVSPYISGYIPNLITRCVEGVSIYIITIVPPVPVNDIDVLKNLIHQYDNNEYRVVFNTVFFKGSMLHEKLYIIDDEIVHTGSYNFTRSGVNTNTETAVTIKDPKIVSEIVAYFDELFKTNLYGKWDPAELGKIIWANQSK